MTDQQRIDVLNGIINQYESLVWLRDTFKDVAKYREAMSHQESDLKALADACIAKQTELDGLKAKYAAKEAVMAKGLAETELEYVASLAKAAAQYDQDASEYAAKQDALKAQLASAHDVLAKAEWAAAQAAKKQASIEASMAKALKDYEAYKASL
mgnify:FL=1